MTCSRIPALKAIVCGSPAYWIRDRSGKEWHFEFHEYCGPSLLKKDGGIKRAMPGEKSPFWDAFQAWFDDGKRWEEKDGKVWAVYGTAADAKF